MNYLSFIVKFVRVFHTLFAIFILTSFFLCPYKILLFFIVTFSGIILSWYIIKRCFSSCYELYAEFGKDRSLKLEEKDNAIFQFLKREGLVDTYKNYDDTLVLFLCNLLCFSLIRYIYKYDFFESSKSYTLIYLGLFLLVGFFYLLLLAPIVFYYHDKYNLNETSYIFYIIFIIGLFIYVNLYITLYKKKDETNTL